MLTLLSRVGTPKRTLETLSPTIADAMLAVRCFLSYFYLLTN